MHLSLMIDEKYLDRIETLYEKSGRPNYSGEGFEFEAGALNAMPELIRLARLGLWAKKHAIPALEWYSGSIAGSADDEEYIGDEADDAINALRKLNLA